MLAGQAERLASTADKIKGLQLGRAEVLKGLFLGKGTPDPASVDCHCSDVSIFPMRRISRGSANA